LYKTQGEKTAGNILELLFLCSICVSLRQMIVATGIGFATQNLIWEQADLRKANDFRYLS
jgi:hypothetical protein